MFSTLTHTAKDTNRFHLSFFENKPRTPQTIICFKALVMQLIWFGGMAKRIAQLEASNTMRCKHFYNIIEKKDMKTYTKTLTSKKGIIYENIKTINQY